MLAVLQGLSVRASRALGLIGFLALLGVSALTVLDVLLRWLFSAPILGLNDVVLLVTTVGVTCCFPSAMAERQHMRVTAAGRVIAGRHGHNLFEAVGSVVTLGFFALMAWQFVKKAEQFTRYGDHSPLLHIPVGPFWWVAAAAFVMAALAQAIIVADDLAALATGRALPEPVAEDVAVGLK